MAGRPGCRYGCFVASRVGPPPGADPFARLKKVKRPHDAGESHPVAALLARTPARALTIAYNAKGEPWKPRQLNQAVDRLISALVKIGRARETLTIHGLRHSRGVELALAGASDAEIMSQLEHATDRAAKIYRRQADRRKLADAAQGKVDQVFKLRRRAADRAARQGR
jgi:hypothetical protein